MKLKTKTNVTETQGLIQKEMFGIGNLQIIFDILRNKLYKNPILAICREISANARDANREAGKGNVPIEIWLPTHAAPSLLIKDQGKGIDPDRMKNVFINYGASTKRDDNVQQGAFGIGAKSGFAYSDTFTVITTTADSKTRTYSAYIDSSGVGELALLSEAPATGPTGTTINIPVKSADFSAFAQAIIEATTHWDVRPVLKGSNKLPTWPESIVLCQGDKWKLTTCRYLHETNGNSLAIIDGISYPIDSSQLKTSRNNCDFLNHSLHFEFGNGELSLAASRDTIQYDEETVKTIVDRITAAQSSFISTLEKKIQNMPTYKEAVRFVTSLNGHLIFSAKERISKIEWNKCEILIAPLAEDVGRYARLAVYDRLAYPNDNKKDKNNKEIYCSNRDRFLLESMEKSETAHSLYVEIDRIPRYSVVEYFKQHPKLKSLRILCVPKVPTTSQYNLDVEDANGEKPQVKYNWKLIQNLELKEFPLLKEPPGERKERIKSSDDYSTVIGYHLSEGLFYKPSPRQIPNQGGIYVELDSIGKLAIPPDIDPKFRDLYKPAYGGAEALTAGKHMFDNIYGFTKTRIPHLTEKWKRLDEVFVEKRAKLLDRVPQIQNALNAQSAQPATVFGGAVSSLIDLITDKNSTFIKYIETGKSIQKELKDELDIYFLVNVSKDCKNNNQYYYGDPATLPVSDLRTLLSTVTKQYPLLSRGCLSNFKIKDIAHYINLVDAAQNQGSKNKK